MKKTTAVIINNQRQFEAIYEFLIEVKGYQYASHDRPTYGSGLYGVSIEDQFRLVTQLDSGSSCYDFVSFEAFSAISGCESNDKFIVNLSNGLRVELDYNKERILFKGDQANNEVPIINSFSFETLGKIQEAYLKHK